MTMDSEEVHPLLVLPLSASDLGQVSWYLMASGPHLPRPAGLPPRQGTEAHASEQRWGSSELTPGRRRLSKQEEVLACGQPGCLIQDHRGR